MHGALVGNEIVQCRFVHRMAKKNLTSATSANWRWSFTYRTEQVTSAISLTANSVTTKR